MPSVSARLTNNYSVVDCVSIGRIRQLCLPFRILNYRKGHQTHRTPRKCTAAMGACRRACLSLAATDRLVAIIASYQNLLRHPVAHRRIAAPGFHENSSPLDIETHPPMVHFPPIQQISVHLYPSFFLPVTGFVQRWPCASRRRQRAK